MKNITAGTLLLLITACSSHIVERSDDLRFRPQWANLNTPSFESDGKIHFITFVEVTGTSSKSAALNMSDEKAFSEPMRAVVDVFLEQNQVGEELRRDDMFGRRIISATKGYRPPMPTLKISHRYWEKISSESSSELRAYSMAELTISDFNRAQEAYLAKLRGDPEVKKILDEVGAKQRESVMKSEVSELKSTGEIKLPSLPTVAKIVEAIPH